VVLPVVSPVVPVLPVVTTGGEKQVLAWKGRGCCALVTDT
jgi:hypothetical protein